MAWWLDALSSNWDGSVAIFNKDVSHADVDLASDAAGCGWGWWRASPGSADFGVGWFPQEIIDLDMAVRRPAYASTRGSLSANICQKELYGAYRALLSTTTCTATARCRSLSTTKPSAAGWLPARRSLRTG